MRTTGSNWGLSWGERWHDSSIRALYLHIPFCKRKCSYCDFASFATPAGDARMHAYADTLISWVEALSEAGLLADVRTAYLGGGTPTLLGADLVRLVSCLSGCIPHIVELTSEANPESLSPTLLDGLGSAGLTRISIGVQSTDDTELRMLGRIHDASTALSTLRMAVSSGIDVSADLMCAIPFQSAASWRRSLSDVIATGVGHVSVYPLQIEESTPFWELWERGEIELDPDSAADRMLEARSLLMECGFQPYEVASYARDGAVCEHNVAYWSGIPYLGLGTSAASMLPREAYRHLRGSIEGFDMRLPDPPDDASRIRIVMEAGPNRIAGTTDPSAELEPMELDCEYLGSREMVAEDLMLAARTSDGLGAGLIRAAEEELGAAFAEELDATLKRLVTRGLLDRDGNG